MKTTAVALVTFGLALSACSGTEMPVASPQSVSIAPQNAPSGPALDSFARDFLNSIQAQSFAQEREYCGYFFVDPAGSIRATPPIKGSLDSCDMPAPRRGQGVFASYHTHGAADLDYDGEVPSRVDLLADFQFGIDGYVSTPGGRVWLVDYQTRSTRLLCDVGCVLSDPRFREDPTDTIQPVYTLQTLEQRAARF